jgi:hypothetical protein
MASINSYRFASILFMNLLFKNSFHSLKNDTAFKASEFESCSFFFTFPYNFLGENYLDD